LKVLKVLSKSNEVKSFHEVEELEYWNPLIERMPRSELKRLQEKRFRQLMLYTKMYSQFYNARYKELGVNFDKERSLDDLQKLPFTLKQNFRDTYPKGMLCTPSEQIIRYHVSSGTTGKPTIVGYTKNDIYEWSTSLARALTSLGVGRSDVIQNSYGYGLFTGGLGFHYGGEMIGSAVLPTGPGLTERQLELMQDMDSTVIACTPSYFLHIAEVARSIDLNFTKDTKLRMGLFGAEPWSENMRHRIEESTGIKVYDVYGTSELSGPLFMECKYQNGLHVWADQYMLEIINPKTGEVLDEGEKGELVVTTLAKEALPLIRYRTGDITSIYFEECECGRTHPRIMRIQGRVDDMLIIRGINVFPSQVESVIMKIPEVGDNYQLIVDRVKELDTLTIKIEVTDKIWEEKKLMLEQVKKKIIHSLRNVLNLAVDVELVEPGGIPRSIGKAKRVVDKRKI
jgi:phenylacetate-CoA ligase